MSEGLQAAQAAAKWFAASISAALMAAVALPLTILSATNFIDGAWGIALDRAGQPCKTSLSVHLFRSFSSCLIPILLSDLASAWAVP